MDAKTFFSTFKVNDMCAWYGVHTVGLRTFGFGGSHLHYSEPRKMCEAPTQYAELEIGVWTKDEAVRRVQGYVPIDECIALLTALEAGEDFQAVSDRLGFSWNS